MDYRADEAYYDFINDEAGGRSDVARGFISLAEAEKREGYGYHILYNGEKPWKIKQGDWHTASWLDSVELGLVLDAASKCLVSDFEAMNRRLEEHSAQYEKRPPDNVPEGFWDPPLIPMGHIPEMDAVLAAMLSQGYAPSESTEGPKN